MIMIIVSLLAHMFGEILLLSVSFIMERFYQIDVSEQTEQRLVAFLQLSVWF